MLNQVWNWPNSFHQATSMAYEAMVRAPNSSTTTEATRAMRTAVEPSARRPRPICLGMPQA